MPEDAICRGSWSGADRRDSRPEGHDRNDPLSTTTLQAGALSGDRTTGMGRALGLPAVGRVDRGRKSFAGDTLREGGCDQYAVVRSTGWNSSVRCRHAGSAGHDAQCGGDASGQRWRIWNSR